MSNTATAPVESDYKGSPIIVLPPTSANAKPFQFGLNKARLILKWHNEIKAFVDKHEASNAVLEKAKKALREKGMSEDDIKATLGIK